ncbi:MAG: hypothetical protein KDD42_02575, partial [Bdellovibrionales bacterium]|nr:hypothetical protein [Bdellovibrionales bacterium]
MTSLSTGDLNHRDSFEPPTTPTKEPRTFDLSDAPSKREEMPPYIRKKFIPLYAMGAEHSEEATALTTALSSGLGLIVKEISSCRAHIKIMAESAISRYLRRTSEAGNSVDVKFVSKLLIPDLIEVVCQRLGTP